MKTLYIKFQFSNFDGKGTANVVIKHEDFPDKSFDVGLNTVTGNMSGGQVHEVEFSDEPTPVYIALGDGATGEFSIQIILYFLKESLIIKSKNLRFYPLFSSLKRGRMFY